MDAKGKIVCYATAQQGIDLDRSVNKTIDMYGRFENRTGVRGAPYMVVSPVR